jgi:hypothetical protein
LIPDANIKSIRSALARAFKEKKIVRSGRGKYRSSKEVAGIAM